MFTLLLFIHIFIIIVGQKKSSYEPQKLIRTRENKMIKFPMYTRTFRICDNRYINEWRTGYIHIIMRLS